MCMQFKKYVREQYSFSLQVGAGYLGRAAFQLELSGPWSQYKYLKPQQTVGNQFGALSRYAWCFLGGCWRPWRRLWNTYVCELDGGR